MDTTDTTAEAAASGAVMPPLESGSNGSGGGSGGGAVSSAARLSSGDATASASTEAASAAPAASSDLSVDKDQLRRAFSGDALAQLEELGVSAFNSADVERNVLASALEEGEIEDASAAQDKSAATAGSAEAAEKSATSAPARKRVPKKSAAQLDLERERSSFVPLPAPRPRERIVHPMERPAAKANKPFRMDARRAMSGDGSGGSSSAVSARSLISRRVPDGESVMERALQSSTLKEGEDAARDRQRMVEAGEITPFGSMAGMEKGFQRVATQRIGNAAAVTSSSAAASKPASTSISLPLPHAASEPAYSAAAAPSRALPVNISPYTSPFPSRPAPHAALTQSSRSSAAKSSSSKGKAVKKEKEKPGLARAATATAAASPTAKKPPAAKRARSSTAKRVKREQTSSSEDEEFDDSDNSSRRKRRSASSRAPPQRWRCEACTFINPSDFSKRCEVCQTVRTNFDPMPLPDAPAAAAAGAPSGVKTEPIELDSDGEAVLYQPVQRSDAPSSSLTKVRGSKRKRVSVKTEPGAEGSPDGEVEAEGSAEADDADADAEWQADADAGVSTSEDSGEEEEVDEAVDPVERAVDRALRAEDAVHDSDDEDEDELERMALEEEEEEEEVSGGRGKHSSGSRRARPMHDDFEQWRYEERVTAWREHCENEARLKAIQRSMRTDDGADPAAATAGAEEDDLDVAFDGGYILPSFLWNKLFAYQKTCVKWLWELHAQGVGGIIADEMGLGKTIQVISFLAGLHYSVQHAAVGGGGGSGGVAPSNLASLGPTLLVVPATILSQWMRECHEWYPELRVIVLHDSVSHGPSFVSRERLVQRAFEGGGVGNVLITTYQSVATCRHLLLPREWGYVVLDEGHKIRSPDARITLLCKQLLSVHRLVLTGSPIQNNLTELWSLFDFVFPGKLGTLPVFEDEFASPILVGGYTSASPVQVALAYKCALILRDLINPYILRRVKADVAQQLPPKTEQVLFCNLTPEQHQVYRDFLDTHARDIGQILAGRLSLFRVIHYLRKICNHPDLLQLEVQSSSSKGNKGGDGKRERRPQQALSADYGAVSRSGKLMVLRQVLRMWFDQGHRCLVFSQTRQMLDILESFVRSEGYTYARVDGATSIAKRLPLIDSFNHSNDTFVMLLTTRAGGLGVNLTGADRVVLFDPDWNPMQDKQSSDRAYRIGQGRPVTVYRLITRGCIEEKVYHRQIWKQFLTDKILRDPKQKRFFSNHDIKDLFSLAPLPKGKGAAAGQGAAAQKAQTRTNALGGDRDGPSETADIFQATGGEIRAKDVLRAAKEAEREEEERRRRQQQQEQEQQAAELEEGEVAQEDVPMTPAEAGQATFFPPPSSSAMPTSTPRKLSRPPSQPGTSVKRESAATLPELPPQIESAAYESDSSAAQREREREHHARSAADDNRILAQLFTSGGLQSAMSHDRILGASSQEEAHIVATLAHKKASKAVLALKHSRQQMRDQPVNAPTWTGRNGTSGAPSFVTHAAPASSAAPKPRFGASSRKPLASSAAAAAAGAVSALTDSAVRGGKLRAASFPEPAAAGSARHFDSSVSGFALTATTAAPSQATDALHTGGAAPSSTLLQRMRARSHVSSAMASHTGLPDSKLMEIDGTGSASGRSVLNDPSASSAMSHSDALLHALREHLAARPEGVPSAVLIGAFEGRVGSSEADKLVFREMLRSVAELTGPKKNRRWTLREEFK